MLLHWVSSPSHLQRTFFLDHLTLKMKAIWSFKTTHPMTQHHIPQHLNLTQYIKKGLWTDINVCWASVVSTMIRLWAGQPRNQRSVPSSVKKFLSSTASRQAVRPNQPATQSVPWFFSQTYSGHHAKPNLLSYLVPKLRMSANAISLPLYADMASTGTLPFKQT